MEDSFIWRVEGGRQPEFGKLPRGHLGAGTEEGATARQVERWEVGLAGEGMRKQGHRGQAWNLSGT